MYRDYVENEILALEPVELVRLLYSKAIERLQKSLVHLEAGTLPQFTTEVCRVMEIVAELQGSIDREADHALADSLAALYAYMQQRLSEALAEQQKKPIVEVLSLMATLYEGWKECQVPAEPEAAPAGASSEMLAGASRHSWTL